MNHQSERINYFQVSPPMNNPWWSSPFVLLVMSALAFCAFMGVTLLTNPAMGGLDHSHQDHADRLQQQSSLGNPMDVMHVPGDSNGAANLSRQEPSHHNHMMKHERHEERGEGAYDLIVKTDEATAGMSVTLLLKPIRIKTPYAQVPLAIVHEKKIHLLMVSKDLSYFAHEHPVEKEEGYYVLSHTFPKGGEYILFADYTPIGSHENIKRHHLVVTPSQHPDVESRPGDVVRAQDLTWEANGYKVSLATQHGSGLFPANTPVVLKANVTRYGQAVTDLSPFLGALAHMAIFSKDTTEYVHVHPLEAIGEGPDILLATNFTHPGLYKIWMGFNHQDQIQTSAFVVQAK